MRSGISDLNPQLSKRKLKISKFINQEIIIILL